MDLCTIAGMESAMLLGINLFAVAEPMLIHAAK